MATSIVRRNRNSSRKQQQQPTPNNNNQPLLLSPPKKSVSFDNNNQQDEVCVEIQEIERLDQSLWYTNKDFKKFKRRDRKMCKLLFGEKMDPNTLEFMTGGNETPRGLEHMSPIKQQLRTARQRACAEAIATMEQQKSNENECSECIIARIHQDFSAKAKADAIKLASRDAQFVNDHILLSSTRRRVNSCFSALSPELLTFGGSSSDHDNTTDDDDDSTTETTEKSKNKKASSTRSSRPAMLERSPAMLDLVRHTTI